MAFFWLFTLGIGGIGWFIDIIIVMVSYMKQQKSTALPGVPIQPPVLPQTQDPVSSQPADQQPLVNSVAVPQVPEKPKFFEFGGGMQKKYEYEGVKLYTLPQEYPNFKTIKVFDYVEFVQEPENTYDNQAVYVTQNGIKLGYLHKGTLQKMANDYICAGRKLIGFVSGLDYQNGVISIDIAYYAEIREICSVQLTGSKKQEAQDNILQCQVDDAVCIEYDDEKDQYIVTDEFGNFIGKLPKSAHSKIEDLADVKGVITDIESKLGSNYESHYVVKVSLFS